MQLRQHTHGQALSSIRQVVEDVPTIGHLDGVRSTASCSAGVRAISVAADDLRARMFGQPTNQRISGRVLEQVDHLVPTTIDENRAVTAPAPKREFIHPKDPRRLNWRVGECAYQ